MLPTGAANAATPKPNPNPPFPMGDMAQFRGESGGMPESSGLDADSAVDAAFAKVMGEPANEETPTREESPDKADTDEAGEEESAKPETDDEWETAKADLKKGKWPESAVKALSRKEALDLAEHSRKMSRDFSKLAGENGGLKSALEKLKRSQGANSGDASQAAATPKPVIDEKAFEPFLKELGETAGKPAVDAFRAVNEHNAQLQSEVQALKSQMEVLNGFTRSALAREAKAELVDKFPQLNDAEAFERVQVRMTTLAGSGEYGDVQALMRDAAVLEFADELLASRKEADAQTQRRNGKMTAPKQATPKNTSTARSKRDSAEDAAFDAIMGGKSSADAAAIFRAHAQ